MKRLFDVAILAGVATGLALLVLWPTVASAALVGVLYALVHAERMLETHSQSQASLQAVRQLEERVATLAEKVGKLDLRTTSSFSSNLR